MDLLLQPNFDHKFAHKLQKFCNLWQNGRKLLRKKFYGIGPWSHSDSESGRIKFLMRNEQDSKRFSWSLIAFLKIMIEIVKIDDKSLTYIPKVIIAWNVIFGT